MAKKRRFKILDVVTTPYFTPKGSSMRVDALLKKLSKNNDVDLLVYPCGEDPKYKNVRIIRLFPNSKMRLGVSEVSIRKMFLDMLMLFKAFGLMIKNKYDIVHCEDFEAAFVGFILSFFFRKSKYVYDLHNTVEDNLRITRKPEGFIKIAKKISRTVYSRFDLVITNWDVYRNVSKHKQFLLYDQSNINEKKRDIPTKKKYLAYAGNFKKYQGVEEFVKVYAKVNPSFDLVLVGNPTEDLKNLVKNLGLNKKVHLTGLLDVEESNYILTHSEMCLIPRIDGDQPGLKMVHHIMLGKISLASDIDANRELLENKVNSILYSGEEELMKILRDIDSKEYGLKRLEKGIKKTQEHIQEIWSEEYFNENYFKDE